MAYVLMPKTSRQLFEILNANVLIFDLLKGGIIMKNKKIHMGINGVNVVLKKRPRLR